MTIKFLGTAAAEGVPAYFCQCDVCTTAKKLKGRNYRTRSQALVNDDLLIDFPPDTYMHILQNDIDMDRIKNIVITHSHEDHLFPPDIGYRRKGFCAKSEKGQLNVYSNREVFDTIARYVKEIKAEEGFYEAVSTHVLQPFQSYQIGGYTIYPLLADHKPDEICYIYIIQDQAGKALLYAHDTGYLPEQSWAFLQEQKFVFDLVSLDCTFGWLECSRGHMGMKCCQEVKDRMLKNGSATERTVFVANHFSHNGLRGDSAALETLAQEHGFTASYDGRTFQV